MASSLKLERIYHVFLSFRGEDVRNSFLNHLYTTLDHNGFYTYVDSKELRKGEQIAPTLMKAIEESHIAIIIFSKNYASSRWCLEEVAKIMDCKEERDLTVFPLFYKVDPGEVRTPRERYKKAMVEHESKLGKDSKALKRWEKALSDASNLSGWHLKDGDESELLQRIVSEISTHLNQTLLHVATHPLHALVGEGKWFHNGSRIIITTRDSHLLTYLGIDQDHVYEVSELDDSDARELFSKHAFSTHHNFKIRTNLVDSVLNHAKGLPLALEVLGSFLRGRREYEWESALDDISTAPKKGINDVLKISYDGLEPKVKEIFLHIACFFKGWDSEYVKKVLDSCDLKAVIGLQILMERSLIRIESGNIQMHDLIQLMGMDIVIQESDDLGRRSRLWLYDGIVDVLSSNMGNCVVKAIVLQSPEPAEICIGQML
ncbi:TMV resistance protein N-like [Eucalyptus grandis]|uniref:TMV resistance protein N-like n=1 Tax=Eucalyptus grandis TaxID=71139 RepID=UPI00192ED31C|nr:TMV resistance protein N-like [Eucalyptus grandis]